MDKLLDEIESYWSTRTEGYSEVNEKELEGNAEKGMAGDSGTRIFWKKVWENEDSENNSVGKRSFRRRIF